MRKIFQWAMAAILICGTMVFTACTNGDNPSGRRLQGRHRRNMAGPLHKRGFCIRRRAGTPLAV